MRVGIWGAAVGGYAYCLGRKVYRQLISPKLQTQLLRNNYSQREVSLLGGIKLGTGLSLSSLALIGSGSAVLGAGIPLACATLFGQIDDRATKEKDLKNKGFRGHLSALEQGQLTSGALKILGIGTGAALGALAIGKTNKTGVLVWLVDSTLIAAGANLGNLLDLRPGRALKVAGLLALPLANRNDKGAILAGSILANVVAALPADLGEQEMLGDTGANPLGASLAIAASYSLRPLPKLALCTAVVGLNLASEKVSFSKVIASNPVLNWLDHLGR